MDKNVDWIKVRKERRVRYVTVSQDSVESYVLVGKLPHVSFVDTWDMPENWMVDGVSYDITRGSFLFLILSPAFEPVAPGYEYELMFAYRHIVKVTREDDSLASEIKCCAECKFVGEESYSGSHVWCRHPDAVGISLPNRNLGINPDCPIRKIVVFSHVPGEYEKNVKKYLG